MVMQLSSGNESYLARHVGELVVQPALIQSIAAQVSRVVLTTRSDRFSVPVVTDDPSAAWTVESSPITPSDATLDEVGDVYHKLAALTIVSNELVADSDPEVLGIVGDGMARDLARKIDAAYFANTTTNGPDGIESISYTDVPAAGYADLDPFAAAIAAAENVGATLTAFVTDPATALTLAQLKDQTDSRRPLLGVDPTAPTRRIILGVPLYVSPAVETGAVWGIPAGRNFVAMRNDADLQISTDHRFNSDETTIRAITRVTFAFAHPGAVIKITDNDDES